MTAQQVHEQPPPQPSRPRVFLGQRYVEPFLEMLIGYTGTVHGPECEAYRQDTRSLARILLAILRDHPDAPHGCMPGTCPRPAHHPGGLPPLEAAVNRDREQAARLRGPVRRR